MVLVGLCHDQRARLCDLKELGRQYLPQVIFFFFWMSLSLLKLAFCDLCSVTMVDSDLEKLGTISYANVLMKWMLGPDANVLMAWMFGPDANVLMKWMLDPDADVLMKWMLGPGSNRIISSNSTNSTV